MKPNSNQDLMKETTEANTTTKPTTNQQSAWVVCDGKRRRPLGRALKLLGFTVLHFTSSAVATNSHDFIENLEAEKPQWLWWSTADHADSPTSKLQRTMRVAFDVQLNDHRHVVAEGSRMPTPSSQTVFDTAWLVSRKLMPQVVNWCQLGNVTHSSKDKLCLSSYILTSSSAPKIPWQCVDNKTTHQLRHFPERLSKTYTEALVNQVVEKAVELPDPTTPDDLVFTSTKAKKKHKVKVIPNEDETLGEHADEAIIESFNSRYRNNTKDIEDAHDDCGDDDGPITMADEFAMFEGSTTEGDSEQGDDLESLFDNTYFNWSLPGSSPHAQNERLNENPETIEFQNVYALLKSLETYPKEGHSIDVMEMFGGPNSNVIRLGIRRHQLHGGRNFDLATGVDLLDSAEIGNLWRYIKVHQPKIVVCGPPCTSFGPWSHINRLRNPQLFKKQRQIGERLASLTAQICEYQLTLGKHFIC